MPMKHDFAHYTLLEGMPLREGSPALCIATHHVENPGYGVRVKVESIRQCHGSTYAYVNVIDGPRTGEYMSVHALDLCRYQRREYGENP